MRPRFSVVIPTKDSAASISRCMAGVLSQTFAGLELVVVDAGSTDGTMDAVRNLADGRVRTFSSDPSMGDARSTGFGNCRGEWSTTLDPTDEVDPSWLSRIGKLTDRSGASFISCGGKQRFADMSEAPIAPVPLPPTALDRIAEGLGANKVSACLRSGSFVAPTRYFRSLPPAQLGDMVTVGLTILSAVLADGGSVISTPESLLRWNDFAPGDDCSCREEQQLSWAMQALDAISRTPIPDRKLLAHCAALGGDAAARLGRRSDARRLFAVARNALPEVPRYWISWASTLLPFGFGAAEQPG